MKNCCNPNCKEKLNESKVKLSREIPNNPGHKYCWCNHCSYVNIVKVNNNNKILEVYATSNIDKESTLRQMEQAAELFDFSGAMAFDKNKDQKHMNLNKVKNRLDIIEEEDLADHIINDLKGQISTCEREHPEIAKKLFVEDFLQECPLEEVEEVEDISEEQETDKILEEIDSSISNNIDEISSVPVEEDSSLNESAEEQQIQKTGFILTICGFFKKLFRK